jgi:hypothetical protein
MRDNYNHARRNLRLLPLVCILLLAACASNNPQSAAVLPTAAQLPTATPTSTATPATPTATTFATTTQTPTDTPTITPSATLTVTPSATITDTPTPTVTSTPTQTNTPMPTADNEGIRALAALAAQATVLPAQLQPAVVPTVITQAVIATPITTTACPIAPPAIFGTIFANDPTLAAQIGCPVGNPNTGQGDAHQPFERGAMMWLSGPPSSIYVLYNTGQFQRFDDTYNASTDPASGGETPPNGLLEPVRGFGKVWRSAPEVRSGLGWGVNPEAGGTATTQLFDRGMMISLPQLGQIFILTYASGTASGTWRAVAGNY